MTTSNELIAALAEKASRHLILVTATPHSGKEAAFRSLLALLSPDGRVPPLAPIVMELAMTVLFYVPTALVAGSRSFRK